MIVAAKIGSGAAVPTQTCAKLNYGQSRTRISRVRDRSTLKVTRVLADYSCRVGGIEPCLGEKQLARWKRTLQV